MHGSRGVRGQAVDQQAALPMCGSNMYKSRLPWFSYAIPVPQQHYSNFHYHRILTECSSWNTDICGNSSVHKSLYKWCMCFQIYNQSFHLLQSVSDCLLCTCYSAYIEKQGMQCYFLPVFNDKVICCFMKIYKWKMKLVSKSKNVAM